MTLSIEAFKDLYLAAVYEYDIVYRERVVGRSASGSLIGSNRYQVVHWGSCSVIDEGYFDLLPYILVFGGRGSVESGFGISAIFGGVGPVVRVNKVEVAVDIGCYGAYAVFRSGIVGHPYVH